MMKFSLLSAAIALALTGCGGSSSLSEGEATTPVTLSVSDAPLDDVNAVVLSYSRVAFLPIGEDDSEGEGGPIVIDIYKTDEQGNYVDENDIPLAEGETPLPLMVDLLSYQGSQSKALVTDQQVPVGNYKLCVFVNDGDHPSFPSYVVVDDSGNQAPLSVKGNGKCPQGVGDLEQTGVLFFNEAFAVNADNNNFVVEFDLRRGLKEANGQNTGYSIQRTSVDLINTITTGTISGSVALTGFQGCESDSTSGNGFSHAVYLYQGDVAQAEMGPFSSSDLTTPITAANVNYDESSNSYSYEFGFVTPGQYSLGYTCTANDDAEEGLVIGEEFSIYQASTPVSVEAGAKADYNF